MALSTAKKLVLGATVGVVTAVAMVAPAAAHRRHHGHHHHHFRYWHGPSYVTSYGSCDYYFWRWKNTGSRFWKAKYYDCIY